MRTLVTILASITISLPAYATSSIDPSRYEQAVCPVDLPEGSDLGDRLIFGYVDVPQRHAQPEGTQIQLAVARIGSRSEQPSADPLLLINGGPGDSNLDLFIRLAAGPVGQALLAQRDIVIIELRGLRHSKPNLMCEEVFEAQLEMAGQNLSAEEVNETLLTAMQASYERFVKEGIDLSAYNNVESAADIALVMSVLGYDRFNMLAASAGTLVAQHVMRDYPDRVRSVVLNAAVPIGVTFYRDMILNASKSLQRVFESCASDSACNRAYPDLENRFFSHVDALNANTVTIQVKKPSSGQEVDFVLNGDRLSTWLFVSMYFDTQIPRSLHRILSGDLAGIRKHLRIFFPMPSFSYGLSYSVFSTEHLDFCAEETEVSGPYSRFAKGISLFFGPRLIAEAQDFWDVETIDRSLLKPLKSDIPTLILNGEMDHVLPPEYVDDMVDDLENGYAFVFPGVAHSPIDSGVCPFSMILDFLADPGRAPNSECMGQFKHTFLTEHNP